MKQHPYEARSNAEHHPYVKGPGKGLDYYAGTLYEDLVCKTDEEAERAAKIANIAYQEGYAAAQFQMRDALGLVTGRSH